MEVVGIGNPVCDFLVNTDKLPEPDSGGKLLDYSWQGGGKVATGLVALSRLGAEVGVIGVIGDGPYGKFCLKDFKKHGIDVSHLIIDPDSTNTLCVDISEPESMSRSLICNGGSRREIKIKDIDKEYIGEADYLFIQNLDPASREAAAYAQKKDIPVVIDADNYKPEIDKNMELVDIFIGSEFYYQSLFTDKNYRDNLNELQARGPEVVIFTLGERGCVGVYENNYLEQPAFAVEVEDTTGAGDVFHGAFIYGLIQNWDLEYITEFASAVSAIKCTRVGGRAAIPRLNTVQKFLETGEIDYSEIDKRVEFYRTGIFNYDLEL